LPSIRKKEVLRIFQENQRLVGKLTTIENRNNPPLIKTIITTPPPIMLRKSVDEGKISLSVIL
jgi:hypothetical protein